jgi:hypothetical protein
MEAGIRNFPELLAGGDAWWVNLKLRHVMCKLGYSGH